MRPGLGIPGKKGSGICTLHSSTATGRGGKTSFTAPLFSRADWFPRERVKPKTAHTSSECRALNIRGDICCQLLRDDSADFEPQWESPLSEYFFDTWSLRNKAVTVN